MTYFLFELIEGLIIGAGAILPGISGASLAVVFGLYEEFMELVAHPLQRFRPFLRRHFTLCLGLIAGFAGFTLLLDRLFSQYTTGLVWLFSGFIAGTVPGIYRSSRTHRIGPGELAVFFVTAGAMLAVALTRHTGMVLSAPPADTVARLGAFKYLASGLIIGAGSLLPGISASFILIFLGWYGPLLDAFRARAIGALVLVGAGALAALVLFSRLVSALYGRYHSRMTFAVLGFTVGSIVLVFPPVPEESSPLPCVALTLAGFLLSWLLERRQR